mgnify:CR=1 FL=1
MDFLPRQRLQRLRVNKRQFTSPQPQSHHKNAISLKKINLHQSERSRPGSETSPHARQHSLESRNSHPHVPPNKNSLAIPDPRSVLLPKQLSLLSERNLHPGNVNQLENNHYGLLPLHSQHSTLRSVL